MEELDKILEETANMELGTRKLNELEKKKPK